MPKDKLGFDLIGASTISCEWMIGAMHESGVAEPAGHRGGPRSRACQHLRGRARNPLHLRSAARGEDTVSCTGRDGVRSLAVALATLQSAGTGRSVRVHELQAC
jgi:hypothetical protein